MTFSPADVDAPPLNGDPFWADDVSWADAEADALRAESYPDSLDLVLEVADMMSVFAAQRLQRVDALRREALDEAARHGRALAEVVERSVRLELTAALRITEHAAGELLRLAEALVHRYPAALDTLGRAGMTERHAQVLVDAVDAVEHEFRDSIVPRAIELAQAHPVGPFRRALRALIDTVRAQTLAERHESAAQKCRVVVEPAEDGMAWLSIHLPAVEAHAAHTRLTAIAKTLAASEGETRTLDQLRADAAADLLLDGDTQTLAPEARGIRASVTVTVPALSLLCDGAAAAAPAMVEGVGPIPIDRARELCGGADGWMRVLTHPETGMVLSVGRYQYRPPPALRRLVRWRAERCMAPGCGMPASRCEIDHTIAWEHGGQTSLDNLNPLCKGHHTVKHHGGWRVRQSADLRGALEWTSPSGRRYVVEPERRVPVFRPTAAASAAASAAPF
ncbi:DUF222 domain-containing protein [Microbacterium sp. BWT-B31]|uniref:HNH endonuclease signature motif containing protein n=1 Tax=Microbacterium sp. BWT-B31 TaxID=3232072 RepID=UPI0035290621